jgi:1-acyl-sn-glycerol-3-phosphate acyltransferase
VLIARSILYNVLFYLNLAVYLIAAIPTLWMPYRCIVEVAKSWGRTSTWLLRVICGTRVEIRGIEKIPWGPLIVASKHQSTWETFGLIALFADPAFILKRELLWLPFFGWYAWKGRMIPVNRGARALALAGMARQAQLDLARGRQIIIFPEGTRRPAGAEPNYKYGVVHLYAETGVPCLPIALNSGLFWPRRSMLRYPGTIRVEILDPIPPGLDKGIFTERLRGDIEDATTRLIEQGRRELEEHGVHAMVPHRESLHRATVRPDGAGPSPDSQAPRAP